MVHTEKVKNYLSCRLEVLQYFSYKSFQNNNNGDNDKDVSRLSTYHLQNIVLTASHTFFI